LYSVEISSKEQQSQLDKLHGVGSSVWHSEREENSVDLGDVGVERTDWLKEQILL